MEKLQLQSLLLVISLFSVDQACAMEQDGVQPVSNTAHISFNVSDAMLGTAGAALGCIAVYGLAKLVNKTLGEPGKRWLLPTLLTGYAGYKAFAPLRVIIGQQNNLFSTMFKGVVSTGMVGITAGCFAGTGIQSIKQA